MTAPSRQINGNGSALGDLVRQLGNDAKRLVGDEVRLAKVEVRESVRSATQAGMWLGLAAGVGVVCLVALTILLTTVIGDVTGERYWLGAMLTGLAELLGAWMLVRHGLRKVKEPSFTFEETRTELARTTSWAKREVTAIPEVVGNNVHADIQRLVH